MLKFLEFFWLFAALAAGSLTVYGYAYTGLSAFDGIYYPVFSAIALAMFFIRRKQRIAREKDPPAVN